MAKKKLTLDAAIRMKGVKTNYAMPSSFIKYLMQSSMVCSFTGGAGIALKELMSSAIEHIPNIFNICMYQTRDVSEDSFENYMNFLKALYPDKYIQLAFRNVYQFENKQGQGMTHFRPSPQANVVFDTLELAPDIVDICKLSYLTVGPTLFMHHAKTPQILLSKVKNALLSFETFKSDKGTEVALNFLGCDIHCELLNGVRCVSRITEFLEDGESQDIISYDAMTQKYVFHKLSDEFKNKLMCRLSEDKKAEFEAYLAKVSK